MHSISLSVIFHPPALIYENIIILILKSQSTLWYSSIKNEEQALIEEKMRQIPTLNLSAYARKQAKRRIEELNRLFKPIYEDNANGKLSDSRFQMLSDDYEQEELREKLLRLNEEINEQEEQTKNIDRFISKVQKFVTM